MLLLIFVVPLIRWRHFASGPVETLAVIRTLATKCCYRDRNESLRCGRFRGRQCNLAGGLHKVWCPAAVPVGLLRWWGFTRVYNELQDFGERLSFAGVLP